MLRRCVRCRVHVRVLVTSADLCLACVEYLGNVGGSWQTGDDVFMPAIEDWIAEHKARFNYLQAT